MDQQSLWWNHVSGPSRYLHDAVSAAANYRVLLLEEAPFMEHFFHLLQERLLQWDSSLQIEQIQADEWADGHDIGESLMYRYAPQVDYHPMDGRRTEYIAKHNLMAGRMLIVRHSERRTDWIGTAVEYAKLSTLRNGLIVLTYSGPCPLASVRKGIATMKWDDYVTSYDMQLFASYCVAEQPGLSTALRNYITQLASRMAGTDPLMCSALAVEEMAADPPGMLAQLASQNEAAARLAGDSKRIEAIVWEAQIQIVFPIIEQLRRRFIERYRDLLQSVLPQKDEFDKPLATPSDMELRHMWFYCFKFAGFRNADDERAFRLLYKARNELAHLDPLDSTVILNIFALDSNEPAAVTGTAGAAR